MYGVDLRLDVAGGPQRLPAESRSTALCEIAGHAVLILERSTSSPRAGAPPRPAVHVC